MRQGLKHHQSKQVSKKREQTRRPWKRPLHPRIWLKTPDSWVKNVSTLVTTFAVEATCIRRIPLVCRVTSEKNFWTAMLKALAHLTKDSLENWKSQHFWESHGNPTVKGIPSPCSTVLWLMVSLTRLLSYPKHPRRHPVIPFKIQSHWKPFEPSFFKEPRPTFEHVPSLNSCLSANFHV